MIVIGDADGGGKRGLGIGPLAHQEEIDTDLALRGSPECLIVSPRRGPKDPSRTASENLRRRHRAFLSQASLVG
jgi:hypothetical protein